MNKKGSLLGEVASSNSSAQEKSKQPIPDILTLISKEKFRRKMVLTSRIIAVVLIGAILWVGYIQLNYAKEVDRIKNQYGSLGYCYLCGLESLRKCDCQYRTDLEQSGKSFNLSQIAINTAEMNIMNCPVREGTTSLSKFNSSILEKLIVRNES